MSIFTFKIEARHHQFHLRDEWCDPTTAEAWTKKLLRQRFAGGRDIIAVATSTAGEIEVDVAVLGAGGDGGIDGEVTGGRSLIVERSIFLPSGSLVVTRPGELVPDAAKVEARPGMYRCTVFGPGRKQAGHGSTTLPDAASNDCEAYLAILHPIDD